MSRFSSINASRRQLLRSVLPILGTFFCSPILHPSAQAATSAQSKRIVCIGGALSEILYALQQSGYLVGVDTTSTYPASMQQLPQVGYARALNTEGILGLAPSLVIATEDAGPANVIEQLRQSSIAVHILPSDHRFEGLLTRIHRIGSLLEVSDAAQVLSKELEKQWTNIQQSVQQQNRPAPKVGFILSPTRQQILMGGTHTAADAMIRYAGGVNCFARFQGFKPISAESLIEEAPEVLLFTQQGWESIGGAAGVLQLPGIAHTPAGKKQRWIVMDALYLLGFGPRLPQAVQDCHRQLFQV